MQARNKVRRRYVVLPGTGIAGAGMQASIFQAGSGSHLAQAVAEGIDRYGSKAEIKGFWAAAPASTELSGAIGERDFEVLSQRFQDGVATVAMTQEARLALEASHPDLRIFPITRYYLPGRNPRASAEVVAASQIAAADAVQADGVVFHDDAKQHFMAEAAAGSAAGAGVVVGVVDTGIDGSHPALQQAVTLSRCYIPGADPTAGGPVNWGPASSEQAGHGTHVAGIIAARPGHGGPAGIAPQARLFSYRVFPDADGMKAAENPVIIDSIRAAIEDGCHIVNLSLEGPRLKDDGVRSAIADAWSQGVVCVAAAGNGFGNPVSYPAALTHCIAVTATGRDGAFPTTPQFMQHVSNQRSAIDPAIFLAAFSNFGPSVQFTAPGHAIVSTFPGNGWWFNSGTSMAAPFISGMLARLLSDNGNILNMLGSAERSAAMLQMLVGRARLLSLPQVSQEGYGLPFG